MKRIFLALPLLICFYASACGSNEQPQSEAKSALQIVNPKVSTAKSGGPLLVTVIGELKNPTSQDFEDLVLEARLMDADGKVIDMLSESMYDMVVPAGEQIAFRLQGAAATTEASYAKAQVRVIRAQRPVTHRPVRQEKNPLIEMAISWGPMLLFILFILLLVRRSSGKGSYQEKMLTAVNEQNSLLTRQAAAIETIAAALASRQESQR